MNHRSLFTLLLLPMMLQVTACSQHELFDSSMVEQPKIAQVTQSEARLMALPAAKEPLVVSVYDFQDQTGQLKPNTQFAEYSHAVTQGGLAILNQSLLDAGSGRWFTVVERGGLKDLLQERQIINTMRDMYATPNGGKLGKLPPLLYAGVLIEGGIVGYDSNIVTGGAGANYLGIGGNVNHQRDLVTVTLRAVNISNGQVLLSVSSEKTVYSTGIQGNVFKYVSLDHLLEAETGFTMNEPPQLAVRQAVETAVYSLIMEGARRGVWGFADEAAGKAALADYAQHVPAIAAQSPAAAPAAQLPTESTPVNAASAPQAEKKSIVQKPNDFMSFGDENTAPSSPEPLQYPTVPLPGPKAH